MKANKYPFYFIIAALVALVLGLVVGFLAGIQYVLPTFIKEILPFTVLRPLHTLFVISWIILGATGVIYYYLNTASNAFLYSSKLLKWHFWIFMATGLGLVVAYLCKNFEGKEYIEFPSYFYFPIVMGWVLFGLNYIKTVLPGFKKWPAYYWMWGTGIGFMIYHFTEAHLWMLPYFRAHYIQNLAIQWKAGGSFVGAWNMLVYGTALYVMAKISKDEVYANSNKTFFFYFLGLANLMFGWAHHIYIVPTAPWIRYVAYAISMTEWVVLFSIINDWRKRVTPANKKDYPFAYRFILLADIWVFLNVFLALLISIPAINLFTHGTHITVAHSMGTTIGINTFILLASITYILESKASFAAIPAIRMRRWIALFHNSFIGFWVVLLLMGLKKIYWAQVTPTVLFSQLQDQLYSIHLLFLLFGTGILVGLVGLVYELLQKIKSIDHSSTEG